MMYLVFQTSKCFVIFQFVILLQYFACSDASKQMRPPDQPVVVFRPDRERSNEADETFNGNLSMYDEVNIWMSERCVPIVREITFSNAEELTEEGLPFLILFHRPDDLESIRKFNDVVKRELLSEKRKCTNHYKIIAKNIRYYITLQSYTLYIYIYIVTGWDFIVHFVSRRRGE